MLWVLIRSALPGTSNEYPQCMFSCRNKENIYRTPLPYLGLRAPLTYNYGIKILYSLRDCTVDSRYLELAYLE